MIPHYEEMIHFLLETKDEAVELYYEAAAEFGTLVEEMLELLLIY